MAQLPQYRPALHPPRWALLWHQEQSLECGGHQIELRAQPEHLLAGIWKASLSFRFLCVEGGAVDALQARVAPGTALSF